jgi:uncharacterized phage-associated protein
MSDKKVFCDECRKDVGYIIRDKEIEGKIKGEAYIYNGREARCIECDSEIYVADVNDYNLKALYDLYRETNNIVSLDIVLAIPEKYGIGKRPLSILLGWGEQTFSRYCEGDLPTKQYSEIIRKIYEDPLYYREILEHNSNNLKTSTYDKSKKALNAILGSVESKKTKMDLAIEYILNHCEDITPLALQKALYYTQGFYYAFYKKFIFLEECEAWVHGPVYREIYYRYRNYRFDPISGNEEFDDSIFTSSEKAILDSVIKNICCYSGKVLVEFTHSETPWLSARGEIPVTKASNRIISKRQIGEYFISVKEKYNMINPNDIKSYSHNMFEQL